jgi:Glycosyltransferase sugar-binding region containing DXD motif
MSLFNIPQKLHIIWVGNAHRRPDKCIESWRANHPDWQFKLWTDRDLIETRWINDAHIRSFVNSRHWWAVADLMRYEILYREGGVYVDADSFSVRPLDGWLLECEMFACWENTLATGRARLVSNAFLGSMPANPFLRYLIDTIGGRKDQFQRWSWSRMRRVRMGAWRSVGPYRLTRCIYDYEGIGYHAISILPSHMFCPNHYRAKPYSGTGLVYADHQWAGTRKSYHELSASPEPGSTARVLRREQLANSLLPHVQLSQYAD